MTGASDSTTACIFCREPAELDLAREELILIRGRLSYVILNLYPYNSGHLMVVPDRHVPNLATMTPEEQLELMRFTRLAEMALTEAYSRRASTSASTWDAPPAPASSITCTCTSCRAGTATRIS